MFEKLSERLAKTLADLTGRGRLTEDNIADACRQVRMALLEADVAVQVVKPFIDAVKARALGAEIANSLSPGQVFIKILHEELVRAMGAGGVALDLRAVPPVVVLLAGLQGAGKTTTAAKLARLLKEKQGKRVALASCDVHRPAAIEQLKTLAQSVGVAYVGDRPGANALAIARAALSDAKQAVADVLILDTAGRLHVDEEMMAEIVAIDREVQPHQRLFVLDSMAGQDAFKAATAFSAALALTGVVLTKADGDARGGAALSVRAVTGQPILYLGVGEKTEALEPFHPERVASRILGMGDVLSLVEQVQGQVSVEKAQELGQKLAKGKGFDLADLKEQLLQLEAMGGVAALMDKLPGALTRNAPAGAAALGGKEAKRKVAIINSMTPRERRRPDIIDGSRRRRIAGGAGVQVQDVNRLLKEFAQMQKMMKQFTKGGIRGLMRQFGGRPPPGLGGA
jgi:signal recognition particle subunit SRP54